MKLGVSQNTLARVRRLGDRVEQEARHNGHEPIHPNDHSRRSRRHSSVGGSQGLGYLSAPEGRRSRRRSSVTSTSTYLGPKKRLEIIFLINFSLIW